MTSTNWIKIAEARGVLLPADTDKFIQPLESLEAILIAQLAELPFATEPATVLSEQAVEGQ